MSGTKKLNLHMIRMPHEMWDALEQEAILLSAEKSTHQTRSHVIRLAIEQYIERQGKEQAKQ